MAEDPVLRELGQMRGELGRLSSLAGEISTSCAVLVSRSDRAERDLRDLREDLDSEVEGLQVQIDALKERRWPLGVITVLAASAAAVIALIALFVQ